SCGENQKRTVDGDKNADPAVMVGSTAGRWKIQPHREHQQRKKFLTKAHSLPAMALGNSLHKGNISHFILARLGVKTSACVLWRTRPEGENTSPAFGIRFAPRLSMLVVPSFTSRPRPLMRPAFCLPPRPADRSLGTSLHM